MIGVSFNDVDDLASWAEEESFEFELWKDSDKTLAVHYSAATDTSASFPQRITVILDEEGEQLVSYDVGFGFGTHPAQVLDDLRIIWGD